MRQATIISPIRRAASRRVRLSRRQALGLAAAGTVATTGVVLGIQRLREEPPPKPVGTVDMTSEPNGATVAVDGHARGRTPLSLPLTAGIHQLVLGHPGDIPTSTDLQSAGNETVHLACTLWRAIPSAQPLQAPFPGTVIVGADFLSDGGVVLLARTPAATEYSLWRRSTDGTLQRLGPASSRGSLVARPDGGKVAYLAPTTHSGSAPADAAAPLTALWTAADGSGAALRYTLAAPQPGERLTDLAWSPDGRRLLLVAHRDGPGGAQDQLLLLELQRGVARTLVDLPAAIVPGSLTWGPDRASVAFLTQNGPVVSLCLTDVPTRAFRYLCDLAQRDPAALPYPPLAWSPDGRQIVYAAAAQEQARGLGGLLLGAQSIDRLTTASAYTGIGRTLAAKAAAWPVWRPDGDILALAHQNGGSWQIDRFTLPAGRTPAVGALPVSVATPIALRWDVAHAQALLVAHAASGLQAWLLTFGREVH